MAKNFVFLQQNRPDDVAKKATTYDFHMRLHVQSKRRASAEKTGVSAEQAQSKGRAIEQTVAVFLLFSVGFRLLFCCFCVVFNA